MKPVLKVRHLFNEEEILLYHRNLQMAYSEPILIIKMLSITLKIPLSYYFC